MNATLRITGTIATLTLAFTLTACSTANAPAVQETTTPAATTAPVETPAVVETPAPVAAPAAGATITSDDEKAAAEAAGLGVFDTFDADGHYVNSVVFDKAQPLPEPIKAAIAAPSVAAFDAGTAAGLDTVDHDSVGTAEQQLAYSDELTTPEQTAKSASEKTGRNVVVVFKLHTGVGVRWAATAATGRIQTGGGLTSEEIVNKVQAWIASQSDPAAYEVVVAG